MIADETFASSINQAILIMKENATIIKHPFLDRQISTRELIFLLTALLCTTPYISPPFALLTGLAIAQFTGHPYLHLNHKASRLLLQVAIVGIGFGMNAGTALKAGQAGILLTALSIGGTAVAGWILGRMLGIEKKTSHLISIGTAICGGSAIAAVAPVIKAAEDHISVSLGVVFILNAIALFIFPTIGHAFHLSEQQFGWWCAIAIHDTSSVVGAAGKYGQQALEVATTVKLVRALWIMPAAFVSMLLFRNRESKVRIPWFIGLFILGMLANTYIPVIHNISHYITGIARACLTLTLFFIGSGLSGKVLRTTGVKPLLQGALLWIGAAAIALWGIITFA